MAERVPIPRKEGPSRNRLESWLVRKIQGGGLKALPRFQPMGVNGFQCPEQYARTLLAGLRRTHDDVRATERLKDDGRAFRSWVESSQFASQHGSGSESRRDFLAQQGFFA
jgi:hypothetical protein